MQNLEALIKAKRAAQRGEALGRPGAWMYNTATLGASTWIPGRRNLRGGFHDPKGNMAAYVPRGEESLLVADLDLTKATGFYAHRLRPSAC